jgi:hypothetical protein
MKQLRFWGMLSAVCLLTLPVIGQSYELKLGSAIGTLGGDVALPLTLSAPDANVEGLVVVFEWDDAVGAGIDLTAGAAIAEADIISKRVEAGFMALGVVMDNDGQGGEVIPAGSDHDIATANIRCMGVEGEFPVSFADGKYALVGEAPVLDNIIVEGGLSAGVTAGLTLFDGSFRCDAEMAALEMRLGTDSARSGMTVNVPLILDAPESSIQGLVAAFDWDETAGTGQALVPSAALADADTVLTRVEGNYMVFGVIMDNDGQGGEMIGPGLDLEIATASIACGDTAGVFAVTFVDDKYASVGDEPKLDNIVVEGGLSIGGSQGLTLTDGSFECIPGEMAPIELALGAGAAPIGGVASVPLLLSSPDTAIQGLVAVFGWDSAAGGADTLTLSAALDGADMVVSRVDDGANFIALGVVLDSDGAGVEVIPAGNDIEIAVAGIRCSGAEGVFSVDFMDDTYAMVGDSPLLDNLAVVDGLSIGAADGLVLTSGAFECTGADEPDQLLIESASTDPTSATPACADVRVLLTNRTDVEGFVTAICHDGAVLSLEAVAPGAAATNVGADFIQEEVFANGGTLGVVVDLVAPFDGSMIPPGADQHAATYSYCCVSPPREGEAPIVTALSFCDGTLGSPTKDNMLVIAGLSTSALEGLVLVDGEFTCQPVADALVEVCDNGIDDDGDGLVDCDDADCEGEPVCRVDNPQMFACGSAVQDADGLPGALQGSIGDDVDVCFYVKSPEDALAGHAQFDHIQGFSMALTFCCDIMAAEEFDVSGTIVEAIGAEFVTAQADNDEGDGDGCELVLGVLIDALPPFDGATIPPLEQFQRVGCVAFSVKETAACGSSCEIRFSDGINGTGKVPVKNLISVENVSRAPALIDSAVEVVGEAVFFRGDCNFSGEEMGMAINIADAAAGISFLFLPGTWKFEPPCLDACDCNDDGRIDLADVLCVLQFALQNGTFPPAPGPGLEVTGDANPAAVRATPPGSDPTEDKLDCAGGIGCP